VLYNLLISLVDQFSALNVFRYLTFRTGLSVMSSMIIVFLIGGPFIKLIETHKFTGPIRDDGPLDHIVKKVGTPTMGGVLILIGILFGTLLWADLNNSYIWVLLMVATSFGLLGAIDDYLKIKRNNSRGISSGMKIIFQIILSIIAVLLLMKFGDSGHLKNLYFPFFKNLVLHLGLFFIPFGISFLEPYQKSRILTFFNPERDPLGAGYQIIQSKIAVGSGGIFGKGFLQGSLSYLDYLPEKHTDFIFTLFSEEFGFLGSSILLMLYFVMLFRIIRVGQQSKSYFAKFYCFGFSSALFIYIVVNMSMVLGLLPIVGSPLPIMSYGGSALLSIMIGFSIVMSCKIYSKETIS